MTGWITKAIRLKLYHGNTPSELPVELVYGARLPGGVARAYDPNLVDLVSDGETVTQIGGARVVPGTQIRGVEIYVRDEEVVRGILEIPGPEMFELTVRAEGGSDGDQILTRGYISYFRWLETRYKDKPALFVLIVTTSEGISLWESRRTE